MIRRASTPTRFAPFLPLLVLAACTSVLDIEDIEVDPDANGGSLTTEPQGGNKNTGGTKGGSPNTTNSMGGDEPVGGDAPMGGDAPVGGDGPMGGSGMGGEPNPGDPTVRGVLIDFWGNKLPNVALQVGDTLTNTDETGKFVVENVPETYDVSLAFEFAVNAFPRLHGYSFQGLTRRDPTIQVRQGLEIRSATIVVKPSNITIAEGEKVLMAVGGEDGNTSLGNVGQNGKQTSAYWESADTTQQTVHGLYVTAAADSGSPPTAYKGYGSALVALSDSASGPTDAPPIDLTTLVNISSGNVQGTVTPGGGTDRANMVFLRFSTGATLQLLEDEGPNTFTYLVPSIPSSSVTVAASEGYDDYFGPFAVAHADGLAASDKPTLKIPTPATLTKPAVNAMNITDQTEFAFTSPASNPGPFVVKFENQDMSEGAPYQYLWVITAKKTVTIPKVLDGGFELAPGNYHCWNVQTHGKFASVDEMAGSKGFWDPYSVENEPVGPRTASGEWTNSSNRCFTTAP
jgi:hypothetical protein